MKVFRLSFYLLAFVVVISVASLILHFNSLSNGYLYFANNSFLARFGDSIHISEFGLKYNVDYNDITFDVGEGIVKDGENFSFVKTGRTYMKATSGNLKASLEVEVVFDKVEEYFNICYFYDEISTIDDFEKTNEITLFLPSCDSEIAKEDGYYNSCEISIECLKQNYNYELIAQSDVVNCCDSKIYANKLGSTSVDILFENIGICSSFTVNVVPINVKDILLKDDIIYVDLNKTFEIERTIIPRYATNNVENIEIVGTSVSYSNGKFCAKSLGESSIIFECDNITKTVKVIVGNFPDEIKVNCYGEVKFGETISISAVCYKNGQSIYSDIEYIVNINNEVVLLEDVFENMTSKHNIFSAKIKTDKVFEIIVRCKSNPMLSQTIYGNN